MNVIDKIVNKAKSTWIHREERWDFLGLCYFLALDSDVIVEFGLEWGFSTEVFLEATEVTKGKVYSIDWLDRYNKINTKTVNKFNHNPRWNFIKADVTKLEWTGEKIDLLLGDIGEENLEAGLENFLPHLSDHAIIIVPAIYHVRQPNKARIMKEFAERHEDWIFSDITTKDGIGLLKRKIKQ